MPVPERSQMRTSDPLELQDGCEPPWRCCELHLGPLQEQQVFLTTNLPPQVKPFFFFFCKIIIVHLWLYSKLCLAGTEICIFNINSNAFEEMCNCGLKKFTPNVFDSFQKNKKQKSVSVHTVFKFWNPLLGMLCYITLSSIWFYVENIGKYKEHWTLGLICSFSN